MSDAGNKIAATSGTQNKGSSSTQKQKRNKKGKAKQGASLITAEPPRAPAQPSDEEDDGVRATPWAWSPLTDSTVSHDAPLFTRDGRCA
jgi:hypothetical protein